jgi:hypothetical protein
MRKKSKEFFFLRKKYQMTRSLKILTGFARQKFFWHKSLPNAMPKLKCADGMAEKRLVFLFVDFENNLLKLFNF